MKTNLTHYKPVTFKANENPQSEYNKKNVKLGVSTYMGAAHALTWGVIGEASLNGKLKDHIAGKSKIQDVNKFVRNNRLFTIITGAVIGLVSGFSIYKNFGEMDKFFSLKSKNSNNKKEA